MQTRPFLQDQHQDQTLCSNTKIAYLNTKIKTVVENSDRSAGPFHSRKTE